MAGRSIEERLDVGHVCAALERHTRRLTALMRNITAADAPAIGSWSIHDVALHVTDGMANYAKRINGESASELDAIRNMAQWNVETVKRLPRKPLPELAAEMDRVTGAFIAVARSMAPDRMVPWYAGFSIPAVVAVALRLVEHIIHGYDMAKAARETWPIERHDAVAMTYGLAYTSPHFVEPDRLDFEGTLEVRIRGEAPFFFAVKDRRLHVDGSVMRDAGFHISAEPVAWVLVSTERMSRVFAALTGRIIGWGVRPLLPFKLQAASFRG
ncbi:MAG TPA: maleylpyruvate isomerase N-terminal domain-containing protein [Actinomycetota bacterium]|nr:maleylpyruvate isomerase N-terminal domain-containing protein [Actinomycetota bacterium]